MNHALLKIVASAALGNIPTGPDAAFPQWNGPDPVIVRTQAILYSSLSASILAAFIAMLGKQWLNRYASVDRGSAVDRGRQRKLKMDGMITWKFGLVMECLPLMLKASLVLHSYAFSDYLFFINKVIAGVVIGFTAIGLLFYFLIAFAATISYNCPFQTPPSLILRSLIHAEHFKRCRMWFTRIFSQMKKRWLRPVYGGSDAPPGSDTVNETGFADYIELPIITQHQPLPLFDEAVGWDVYVLDSDCIALMFSMPMEIDVTMAILRFIPEIAWHAGIQATPLEMVYETFLECFDRSSGRPILKPALRDMAYLSAKALLHIGIQRKCAGNEFDEAVLKSISSRHPAVGFKHIEGDSELESTLGIINHVFGGSRVSVDWKDSLLTIPHHAWMGHILLFRVWDVLRKGEPLPEYIKEFVLHSLRLDPPPPVPIIADCLFIIGLILGIKLHVDDLLVRDKR